MALFDLNSRYTKSMEHGGSYERDASIGGYNRKELRGLNRQARRGSLTQRERARLKYLTDERRGRRKRGLLSGLGGAAATLGALAAAGKLGEGEGGSALMDAIKGRLSERRSDKLGEKGEGGMEGLSPLEAQEMLTDSPRGLMESGPGIGEAPAKADMTGFDSRDRQGFEGDYRSGNDPVEDLAMSERLIPLEEEEDMDEEKVASLLEILRSSGVRPNNPNEVLPPNRLMPRPSQQIFNSVTGGRKRLSSKNQNAQSRMEDFMRSVGGYNSLKDILR